MKTATHKKNHLFAPAIAAGILMVGSTAHAATVIASADSRGQGGTTTTSPTTADAANLGVGPVSGSDQYFRTYLTFNLTTIPTASTVSLTLFGSTTDETNTSALLQTFTLFQVASNWNSATPLPGGTNLATFSITPTTGNSAGNISFSSASLTSAFNAAVGSTLYLGIMSPEGEAAASGTRSFRWFGSTEDAGLQPTLTYTAIPEPSAALLGGLGLLMLLRRRR